MKYFKGYGGPVNDFLSWGLWQPISKISFMTYFFHMSSEFYYFAAQVDKDLTLIVNGRVDCVPKKVIIIFKKFKQFLLGFS